MRPVEQLSRSNDPRRDEDVRREEEKTSRVIDNEQIVRMAFDESTSKGFEALFRLYYQALYSHALRFVYTKERAEDIVCDVFHDFWKSNSFLSLQGIYRAYTYVRFELKEERKLTDPGFSEHVPTGNNPESLMEYDELHQRIDRAELPPQCQRVFLLSRIEADGVELIPYLTGKRRGTPHRYLFWQGGVKAPVYARSRDWKLSAPINGGPPTLFNLALDIGEKTDVSGQYPEKTRRMLRKVNHWMKEIEASQP